ncbi:diacylglycerol kinase family protein [Tessaracoccus antarcticus]|uniref:Phosphatase PAP2 family protein n=1 Tax=Tessaracoccus antarcticus TaxID=2479848 RepID=A0A3M0GAD0_9ACTN|nr:diacylglycerol kinase family protein [Tessaracoccus antarcticus]RMB61247.1 phosphatase PAP2 family protein [Tessaracoccus antarcticus]
MTTWQRSTFNVVATVVFAAAFVMWTLFLPTSLDELWQVPSPTPQQWSGQIGAAIALVGLPAVIYPCLLVASWWASRRQLTSVSAALVLSVGLGFGSATLLKELIGRDRPPSEWLHLISHQGPGYPAPHMVAITIAAIMFSTLATVARRRRGTIRAWQVAGALLVVLLAVTLLLTRANHITDVVGGILLGALVANASNLVCGVNTVRLGPTAEAGGGRAAIIYNPTKVLDQTVFKGLIERRLAEDGWEPPLWLSTSIDDPGRGMAHQALDAGVDLVMVAGGDGTVRVVCGALANTGATVAIVPSGTGNLLAGNMKIPFDAERALDVALRGRTRAIDILEVTVPGRDVDHAAVMCGVGADAAVLNDTNEELKNQIGVAAYVIAGLSHVKARPFRATVTVDDDEPLVRDASLVMVGNVSDLQAGLTLMPDASAGDGVLDVLIASPRNQVELTQMVSAILAQSREPSTMDRRTGERVSIELGENELYELDGDVIGETTHLLFQVLPAALQLRVPH